MKVMVIASTRPEVIKLSPVLKELERRKVAHLFVTTGQHYDALLFDKFLSELDLRKPDYNIEVGSGSQGYQTSFALLELEKVMQKEDPDAVVVEGDTNSVLSSALAAVKLGIPVAHVEAGLRSHDRTMPEEINRILADHCSELLFAPTENSALNLVNEGIPAEKVFITGNTIVDATLSNIKRAFKESRIASEMPGSYALLTLHRAENVDHEERFRGILGALSEMEEEVVFPVHPRTRKMIEGFGMSKTLEKGNIRLIDPVGYLDFLALMKGAKIVLTDSGGVQEEATTLGVPCITLRKNTERPESVEAGGNLIAGVEKEAILETLRTAEKTLRKVPPEENPFGDGKAARRIVEILKEQHRSGKLEIEESDFTHGIWKRAYVKVDRGLAGKRIGDLDLDVLKVIDGDTARFPKKDLELKEGQVMEILKR